MLQNGTVLKDSTTEEVGSGVLAKFGDSPPISLTQEGGSLSDSGISDSGSEQELSERERRLAALRRLTRSLESQLAPGSEALVELLQRVEDAETELRDLQKQCRELIVRTAASVEARAAKRTNGQVHHFIEWVPFFFHFRIILSYILRYILYYVLRSRLWLSGYVSFLSGFFLFYNRAISSDDAPIKWNC